MLPFVTKGFSDPWTDTDIRRYESEGSQRDSVVYNSFYNSRIELTEENIFLCSMKLENDMYKNFYLIAVTRNLFYFLAYLPEGLCLENIKDDQVIRKILTKLKCHQALANSFSTSVNLREDVVFTDGCSVLVKVNANIGEFLFPKYKEITNLEIRSKFTIVNKIYNQVQDERKLLLKAIEAYQKAYDSKIQEHNDKLKKKFAKIACRKVVLNVAPMLLGIPPLGALDSLFSVSEVADMVDIASTIDAISIIDNLMV